jgi:hypothetical protein
MPRLLRRHRIFVTSANVGLWMFARLSRMLGGDAFCGNDVPLSGV